MHHTHQQNIQIFPKPNLQKYSEFGHIEKFSDFQIFATVYQIYQNLQGIHPGITIYL
jgi:hypothetical protein